jgi:hypothetical protein
VAKEQRCGQHSDGGAQQEDAARQSEVGGSEPANLEGQRLGETEAAQKELLRPVQEPGKEADQLRPHEESCEAPGELMPQGGEYTGSPGVGGGDCSGAQHQVDLATESLTNTAGCCLVTTYQVISLSVTVALLILLLMGILRMALDIVIRTITIARVRSCGWWLIGAFWGVLFQVAVVTARWAMARGMPLARKILLPMSQYSVDAQSLSVSIF